MVCTTGYLPHVHNLLSGSGNNGLNDKNENKSKWNEKIEEQCLHSSRTKKLVMKINDLPHCPQVSTGRLSSNFHFLPRPISLADGNEIINNPWFQISCSEKWWKLYFATKFYLCVSFLGFAIIAINLAKLPQEGNCSNRLLWRATLEGKKRKKII